MGLCLKYYEEHCSSEIVGLLSNSSLGELKDQKYNEMWSVNCILEIRCRSEKASIKNSDVDP